MTFLAASMEAAYGMGVPLLFVVFSVRIALRCASVVNAAPSASRRSASSKVMVMSVAALETAAPFSGLKVGAAGAVVSQRAVAATAWGGPRLAPSVAASAATVTTTSALPVGVTTRV